MKKPTPTLLIKILSWFFLNLILLGAVLTAFMAFQPQINIHALLFIENMTHDQVSRYGVVRMDSPHQN